MCAHSASRARARFLLVQQAAEVAAELGSDCAFPITWSGAGAVETDVVAGQGRRQPDHAMPLPGRHEKRREIGVGKNSARELARAPSRAAFIPGVNAAASSSSMACSASLR